MNYFSLQNKESLTSYCQSNTEMCSPAEEKSDITQTI